MVVEKRCEAAVSVSVADQILLVNKQARGTAESEHIPDAQAHGFGRSVHDNQKQYLECRDGRFIQFCKMAEDFKPSSRSSFLSTMAYSVS